MVDAVYRTNTYTISFVVDGVVVDTVTVSHGDVLAEEDYPAVPEKEGYVGEWVKVTDPITGPVTIEAVYTAIPTEPEVPTEPEQPTEDATQAPTEDATDATKPTKPGTSGPDTGDHAAMGLWLALLALSGLAVLFTSRKKWMNI